MDNQMPKGSYNAGNHAPLQAVAWIDLLDKVLNCFYTSCLVSIFVPNPVSVFWFATFPVPDDPWHKPY